MPLARLRLVALDCPDPDALAIFYSQLTGWEAEEPYDGHDWLELVAEDGGVTLAFQKVEDYQAPRWPGQDRPQQVHLDFEVGDLDEAESTVLAIGARKAEHQPGETFRVFLDPVGHPFCLMLPST